MKDSKKDKKKTKQNFLNDNFCANSFTFLILNACMTALIRIRFQYLLLYFFVVVILPVAINKFNQKKTMPFKCVYLHFDCHLDHIYSTKKK